MKKYFCFILVFLSSYDYILSQTIDIQSFASGFDMPVGIQNAGDDRLFVLEKSGIIRIVNPDGSVNAIPFLDIDELVVDITGTSDERGLLGLAFHPDYASNGYFFVNYINNIGNTVISRFSVDTNNADLADPNSQFSLIMISQPYSNHNGGDLAFGPDGYLYIATGDGGAGGDPENRAQDLSSLLGKILRIDVDSTNSGAYGIPTDNPFFNDGDTGTLDEIWAYGLRNPWRFSFDKQTGDIWIADVGQGNYEEINMASYTDAGLNYGWRCYEGSNIFNNNACPDSNTLTFPVGEYPHTGLGNFKCSISGGYRYRGSIYPNFSGLYFFADYCSDEIGVLRDNAGTWEISFSDVFGGNGWSTFGEDISGELYIAGITSGTIYKIIDIDNPIQTWYQDADNDTYGNPNVSQASMTQPVGYVLDNSDCDDTNPNINPGATDIPDNEIDEDCDTFDLKTWFRDQDNDSFGDHNTNIASNSQPNGYVSDNTDCDDTNENINPNATEIPNNNIDENCDGLDALIWFEDADTDTYGNPNSSIIDEIQPNGYVSDNTDCDDSNPNINPSANEIPNNSIDENCNGLDALIWYIDNDNDTFGDPNISSINEIQPNGFVLDNTDCDDSNPEINPNASEIPNNNIDENCDGVDEKEESNFSFIMFPNPARESVFFLFEENEIPISITFYDVLGKHLFTTNEFSDHEIEISTKNLSRGLYLVSIFKANNTLSHTKLLID